MAPPEVIGISDAAAEMQRTTSASVGEKPTPSAASRIVLPTARVVQHPARRRHDDRRAKPELGDLTQALLAVVDQRFGQRERAAARFGDQRRGHPAGARPARVDGQQRLDEVLVEGRTAQQPTAAARDQRRLVGEAGGERGDRRRGTPFGRHPARHPAQDFRVRTLRKSGGREDKRRRIALP